MLYRSSDNDNSFLSATYFVQYDIPFGHMDKKGQKLMKENKRISVCSKKQRNQGILVATLPFTIFMIHILPIDNDVFGINGSMYLCSNFLRSWWHI